jgi:hypothetical protein
MNPVPMAELSFRSYRFLKNKMVSIAGWGSINNGSYPIKLHSVMMHIILNEECIEQAESISGEEYMVDQNILCSKAQPFALLMPVSIKIRVFFIGRYNIIKMT